MSGIPFSKPVQDSVAKVNDEVAVGEDLDFQKRWWVFERIVWVFFTVIILLDVSGLFGRGPLAQAEMRTADETMQIHYERIERTGTPAIMYVSFGPAAIHEEKIKLFVSESIVKELGNQGVVPSPEATVVGNGGLTYTFPASTVPATVEFALQPAGPGLFPGKIQVLGANAVATKILVVP